MNLSLIYRHPHLLRLCYSLFHSNCITYFYLAFFPISPVSSVSIYYVSLTFFLPGYMINEEALFTRMSPALILSLHSSIKVSNAEQNEKLNKTSCSHYTLPWTPRFSQWKTMVVESYCGDCFHPQGKRSWSEQITLKTGSSGRRQS